MAAGCPGLWERADLARWPLARGGGGVHHDRDRRAAGTGPVPEGGRNPAVAGAPPGGDPIETGPPAPARLGRRWAGGEPLAPGHRRAAPVEHQLARPDLLRPE